MEEMEINSKIRYGRSRVINGHGPHRMLEMIQHQMLGRLADEDVQDEDLDLNMKEDAIAFPSRKSGEVKK